MFTPLGPIMQGISMALNFAQTIGDAVKQVAPKAMKGLDDKLKKAGDWATKAVDKAHNFLESVGKGVQQLGNDAGKLAQPVPVLQLPIF
jgi:hypothetical protein